MRKQILKYFLEQTKSIYTVQKFFMAIKNQDILQSLSSIQKNSSVLIRKPTNDERIWGQVGGDINCQKTVKQGFARFKKKLFVLPLCIGLAMIGMKILSKMSLVVDLLIVIRVLQCRWIRSAHDWTFSGGHISQKNNQIVDFEYVLCYMYQDLWQCIFVFFIQVNCIHMHYDFDYVVIYVS